MKWNTDKTIERCITLIKDAVQPVTMDGHIWYDVTNQGLEAEVKLLRLKGELAEHPMISTLIRFNQEREVVNLDWQERLLNSPHKGLFSSLCQIQY